jgi:hypothetical protein
VAAAFGGGINWVLDLGVADILDWHARALASREAEQTALAMTIIGVFAKMRR